MRKTHRLIAAGVLSLPLALTAGGVASADGGSYDQKQAVAGPDGVATKQVSSHSQDGGAKGNGDASFKQGSSSAGPDGASSDKTHSSNNNDQGGLLGVLGL